MPPEIRVTFLKSDDPLLSEVERLFQQMYDDQRGQGLLLHPPPDASGRWLAGIRGALGRLGCLVGAMEGDRLVGFLHAGLHVIPEFLGGGLAGRISHVFLSPGSRRRGVGRRMVEAAVEWLRARGADTVEVQVLSQNLSGLAFWEALGWKVELYQMRKPLRKTGGVEREETVRRPEEGPAGLQDVADVRRDEASPSEQGIRAPAR